jgi:hypothetical protein
MVPCCQPRNSPAMRLVMLSLRLTLGASALWPNGPGDLAAAADAEVSYEAGTEAARSLA